MHVLPVLDLRAGHAVHAVAGARARYRPLACDWIGSSRPGNVAAALQRRYGLSELYVADLDAIEHRTAQTELYDELAATGCRIWLDRGLRGPEDLPQRSAPLTQPDWLAGLVAGLETLAGPEQLQAIGQLHGWNRVVLSLDLHAGRPLAGSAWPERASPVALAERAFELGVRQLLILDLAAVGMAGGPTALPLCRQLRSRLAGVQLWLGGGVRDAADLQQVAEAGVDVCLLGTALYRGALSAEQVQLAARPRPREDS